MDKIKILILNEPEGKNGVTWWRMYRPMLMLEKMYGDQVEIIWNRGIILPVDVERADVAIAWRPSVMQQLSILVQMKDAGTPIIIDHDDDLINIPTGSPAFGNYFGTAHIIRQINSLADMLWASTAELGKVYAHPNTVVVPNSVLEEDIAFEPNPITKTAIWRGDFHQQEDIYAFKEQYFQLAKRCERFIWAGYMPSWKHPDNAEYSRWNNLKGYFEYLRKLRPNFIWKPMRKDLPFNHSKSNIAKLEAICCGAVALTNFNDMPTWEHSFSDAVWKEDQIFAAWQSGREQVLAEYNLESWTHQRYRLINSVLGR